MKHGRTNTETAQLNGWTVGTRLVGDEGHGPTVIRITAIGETAVADASALKEAVSAHEPGERVTVTWTDAAGRSHTTAVTLGGSPVN